MLLAPNLTMPAVALDTGEGEYKGDACVAAVTSAIGLGYRNIDTAHSWPGRARRAGECKPGAQAVGPDYEGLEGGRAHGSRER